jgi:predicted TIM-barrel fold metal-dependent hydrolase
MSVSLTDHILTRRDCLAAAAIGAAGAALPSISRADEDEDDEHPWIDAHSHIWTRDVDNFPLAAGTTVDDLAPPSFTAEELLEVAHRENVGRVVLIQHHPYHGWDNSYVIDAARRYPQAFRVVGMVDTFSKSPGKRMRDLLEKRVTGFRITPFDYKDEWLGGGMEEMWRTAADTGQNICCLIGVKNLPEVDAMCVRHPETPVVIDHFARAGIDGEIRKEDVDALCNLARHKKVTVKLSAYYALGKKKPPYLDLVPMIRRVLDAFGVERAMWASDSPYQLNGENTYAASISLIRDRIDFLSDGDRQALLRTTAERVFYSA